MSKTEHLSGLPMLSDLIPQIERKIVKNPEKYADWRDTVHSVDFTPGKYTQMEWGRYDTFIFAGRNNCLLPCHCCPIKVKDASPDAAPDLPPFSPLAMQAVRGDAADYGAIFARKVQDPRPLHGGEEVARDVQQAIEMQLTAISTWSFLLEHIPGVNWNDSDLLHVADAHPQHSQHHTATPLCAILAELVTHEAQSEVRMSKLFQKWWHEGTAAVTKPSLLHIGARIAAPPNTSERHIQAKSLDNTTRFERALIRVCMPSLHPIVPFQFSLLDLEQLLIEKPTRSKALSEALVKAIGYHAMVVQAHYMLRLAVFLKGQALREATPSRIINCCFESGSCASGPLLVDDHNPDPLVRQARDYTSQFVKRHYTFRDTKRFWFLLYTCRGINWADHIDFDPATLAPTLKTRLLGDVLDSAVNRTFGCSLVQLMLTDKPAQPGGTMVPPSDRESLLKQFAAMRELLRQLVREDFRCRFQPSIEIDPVRQLLPPPVSPTPSTALIAQLSSMSMTQSAHAYLRDNPTPAKVTRDPKPSASAPAAPKEPEVIPSDSVIFVNNKQLKLVEKLYGQREGKLPWVPLLNLFERAGLRVKAMGGTAFHITHISDGGSMILYRPHPDPDLSSERACALGIRLATTFSWSVEMFRRRPGGGALAEQD